MDTKRPPPKDKYYNLSIYPWSVARTDNELTTRRRQAIQAVLSQCQLPAPNISKVKAVTLLGEVHHLYPGFESGMGFDSPYQVTDHSPTSVQGFQSYLAHRYPSIAALNAALNSDYADFAQVLPPGSTSEKTASPAFTTTSMPTPPASSPSPVGSTQAKNQRKATRSAYSSTVNGWHEHPSSSGARTYSPHAQSFKPQISAGGTTSTSHHSLPACTR